MLFCSFGLRVEFCVTLFLHFIPFWPDFWNTSNFPGTFSSTATPECPFQKQPNCNSCDLAAISMVLHDMYCSSWQFWAATCSFGLRVEFCDMILSPSGPILDQIWHHADIFGCAQHAHQQFSGPFFINCHPGVPISEATEVT